MLTPASEYVSYQDYVVEMVVKPRIPKFLYFDEYYQDAGLREHRGTDATASE